MIPELHQIMLRAMEHKSDDYSKLLTVLNVLRDRVIMAEYEKWKDEPEGDSSHDCSIHIGAIAACSNILAASFGMSVEGEEVKP